MEKDVWCPHCEYKNRQGVRFCEKCGTVIAIGCPSCRMKIPLASNFCGECGITLREPKEDAPLLLQSRRAVKNIGFEAVPNEAYVKFVGRNSEVETLIKIYDRVKSGSGQAVELVGEAGVGKTRLVYEFRKMIYGDEYTYYEGRCLPYGGNIGYMPILEILRSYFHITGEDRKSVIQKKLAFKVSQLKGGPNNILSPLQEILSLGVEDRGGPH
jgi:hypothetical protein